MAWFRDLCNNLLDRMEIFLWGAGVTVALCELLRHVVAQMDYRIIFFFPCHMTIIWTFLTPFHSGKISEDWGTSCIAKHTCIIRQNWGSYCTVKQHCMIRQDWNNSCITKHNCLSRQDWGSYCIVKQHCMIRHDWVIEVLPL